MITEKGKRRLKQFITCAQIHLQWLRVKKWELEQSKNKPSLKYIDITQRIVEVTRDIELAYKRLS